MITMSSALVLLKAIRTAGLNQFIFSSTCATYAETQNMLLLDDESQNPFSTDGKTKLTIEHMIQSFHNAYGPKYVTLRYFNASGADAEGDISEEHNPETHLIPIAIQSAMGAGRKMKIFGTDYDTPDGTCIRNYIHVTDIARAHIDSIRTFDEGLKTTAVNIGTGQGVSNLEILSTIERVTPLPLPYESSPRRAGDLTRLHADAAKAETV